MRRKDKLYKEAIKEKDSQKNVNKTHCMKCFEENKKTAKLFGMAFMKIYNQRKRKIPTPHHQCL